MSTLEALRAKTPYEIEALRPKTPYELIPTNLPGAYASPAPPEDFDPHTASPSVLRKHGLLWRRPRPTDDRALVAAWKKVFTRKWRAKDRIVPKFEVQRGRTHHLRKPLRKLTDGTSVGTVWSGAGISGGTWTGVIGFWNVPTVGQPSEPQGNEGGWNSSSWVGLDGYGISNDVLQAGVEQRVDANGNASYVPWFEWFVTPPANPGVPVDNNGYPLAWVAPGGAYQYIYQTNIAWVVNPGDQMFCSVQYTNNNTTGYLYLANETTGQHFSITLVPPPGANFNGDTVEWIMEAPDGGEPISSLPQFTPVTFSAAIACGANNALGNPQNGDALNIEDANGNVLTSTTLGDYTAEVDFIG